MRPALAAALDPVLSQVADLPGSPVRVDQRGLESQNVTKGASETADPTISGSPPVLYLPLDYLLPMAYLPPGQVVPARFVTILRTDVLIQIVDGGKRLNPAQRAVTAALLIGGGDSPTGPVRPSELGSASLAAARRFAALPASARHAWLAAHLVALRAGHVTLQELP